MNFDRLNGTATVFDNNTPANLLQIGLFISRLSPSYSGLNGTATPTASITGSTSSSGSIGDTTYLRLRSNYCVAVAYLLAKRQFFAIREEMKFRGQLCDILINWLDEHNVCVFLSLCILQEDLYSIFCRTEHHPRVKLNCQMKRRYRC